MTRGDTACQKTGKRRDVFNRDFFCEPLFANAAQMGGRGSHSQCDRHTLNTSKIF